MYSFRMSFWMVPESLAQVGALAARDQHVEASRIAAVELMVIDVVMSASRMPSNSRCMSASEQMATPTRPTSPAGQGMIGIHAHLGRQVERNRKPGDALRQQIAIAAIAFLGGSEAGVLAHGPEPAAIHVRIDPAGEGVLAREFAGRHDLEILRAFQKEEMPNQAIRRQRLPNASLESDGSLPRIDR